MGPLGLRTWETPLSPTRRSREYEDMFGMSKSSLFVEQPQNVEMRHRIQAYSIFRVFIKNSESLYVQEEVESSDSEGQSQSKSDAISISQKGLGWIKSSRILYASAKLAQRCVIVSITVVRELRFSLDVFRTVLTLDLMVMSGSGQLNEEWGRPWRYPFGLFRWCLLARVSGCKIAFLSVGAGETESWWTRFFCATALRLAHYKSVRDQGTLSLVSSWGLKNCRTCSGYGIFDENRGCSRSR